MAQPVANLTTGQTPVDMQLDYRLVQDSFSFPKAFRPKLGSIQLPIQSVRGKGRAFSGGTVAGAQC